MLKKRVSVVSARFFLAKKRMDSEYGARCAPYRKLAVHRRTSSSREGVEAALERRMGVSTFLASANSLASSIYRAANTALVEMDELYENTGGIYIISSDEKKNMDVPFDIDEFNKHFGQYTDNEKMEKQNYFMVVKNGSVEYAAVSEDWTNTKKIVGTYPVSTIDGTRIYTSDGSYSLSTERRSLSYLYDKAQEAVNEMIIKQYLEDKR